MKINKGVSINLQEFLELENVPIDKKFEVFFKDNKELEKAQREFAFLCADRAVTDCGITEVIDYFNFILLIYEFGDLELLKSEDYWSAYWAADRAADRAAYWSAYWAAYWAANWAADPDADRAAYWAANWAADRTADRAAYWAANWAADRDAEREVQLDILKYVAEKYDL